MQPGTSTRTLLPMVLFQNMSAGAPSSLLQVAVKNNQQPVWYFNDKISLHVFFTEDGRMERGSFLEVKHSNNSLFVHFEFLELHMIKNLHKDHRFDIVGINLCNGETLISSYEL